jgi:hypothetical protein
MMQVIITGPGLHTIPEQERNNIAAPGAGAGAGDSDIPAQDSQDAVHRARPAGLTLADFIPVAESAHGGFTIHNPGENHELRLYWEYLCFLFRYKLSIQDHGYASL